MAKTFLIVGAGFSGAVTARELAEAGHQVRIIDKRQHVGGNAYDTRDENGLLIHRYGPHIFHTKSEKIFEYLSQFTRWRTYEHRVLAFVNNQYFPIPINRTTVNALYQLNLSEAEMSDYFEKVRILRNPIRTSEDVVLNSVGPDLCNKFFRGYTRKQWGIDLSELSASVAARIPTRTNDDDRYFDDKYQCMPSDGYTVMFDRILNHSNIKVELNTDFLSMRKERSWNHIVYTGPIDAYFDHVYGKLPYRSLRFEHQHIPMTEWFQPSGTINYPNEQLYTRITEFKYLTGQVHTGTSIVYEFPSDEGDPYYPIPRPENEALYKKYEALAHSAVDVTFVGRLATYKYYNMDQVVGAALATAAKLIEKFAQCDEA